METRYLIRDANGHCGTVEAADAATALEQKRLDITDGRHLSAVLDPACEFARFADVVALLSAYARLSGESDRDVHSWVAAGWDVGTDADAWLDAWRESFE